MIVAWLIYAAVPLIFIVVLLVIGILLLLVFMVIGAVAVSYMIKRDMDFTKIFVFQEVWGIIKRIMYGGWKYQWRSGNTRCPDVPPTTAPTKDREESSRPKGLRDER